MDTANYLTSGYCLAGWLKGKHTRQRGLQPKLSDSEVLMMGNVG